MLSNFIFSFECNKCNRDVIELYLHISIIIKLIYLTLINNRTSIMASSPNDLIFFIIPTKRNHLINRLRNKNISSQTKVKPLFLIIDKKQ